MKKTLLATAIASALAASGAQAATVYNQDGTKLDIYGNIQIAYYNTDKGEDSTDEIADNGTTFGFAAEHVIYDGLTGYLKLEFDDIKADEMKTANDREDSGDKAYVGLKGNFGDVRLGSYDQLIDDWIQDPVSSYEGFGLTDSTSEIGYKGIRETDKVTYTSPSLSGLQFAVGTQYKGDAEGPGDEISGNASFFGGAKYAAGAFSIAAVYDDLDNFIGSSNVGDQYGITGQYTVDTLRVALKVERFDSDVDDADFNFYGLGARYGYGNGDIYASYQYVDLSADDTYNEVMLGTTYNVSDAMYVWAEYAKYGREDDAGDGVGAGVTYLF